MKKAKTQAQMNATNSATACDSSVTSLVDDDDVDARRTMVVEGGGDAVRIVGLLG